MKIPVTEVQPGDLVHNSCLSSLQRRMANTGQSGSVLMVVSIKDDSVEPEEFVMVTCQHTVMRTMTCGLRWSRGKPIDIDRRGL